MTEHEKATPRPWQVDGSHIYGPDPDRTLVAQALTGTGALVADRNLIVAAVNSYDASRALIEQMRDALRVADRLDSWAYSSAIAGYQQANRREEEFGRKIDAAKEQVAGALAAAAKFLEGR